MYEEDADYISNLRLQKLLHYAQGCFLAVMGSPLFSDDIVAWKHGPVVESVYNQYCSNGSYGIVFEDEFDPLPFSEEENRLLIQVYDLFGQYSAWKLRDMTRKEAPWLSTPPNEVIKISLIEDYFNREYVE